MSLPAIRSTPLLTALALAVGAYWLYARSLQPELDARTAARLRPMGAR